jgi:hypothetical protein
MGLKRRWLLILAGRLDQVRLDELRRRLELRRMGRLTDREDAHLGIREISGGLVLNLWRDEDKDDDWSLHLDADEGAEVADDVLEQWRVRAEEAAVAVGLSVVEFRPIPVKPAGDHQTAWRNENWLRTAGWDLPAQSLDELWAVLGVAASAPVEQRRAVLREFMGSPSWEPAPSRIRTEAAAFLAGAGAPEGA